MADGYGVKSVAEIQALMASRKGGGGVNNQSFTKQPVTQGTPKPVGISVTVPKTSGAAVATNELAKMTTLQKQWAIATILDKYGIHPVEEMAKWLVGQQDDGVLPLTSDQRVKILCEMASYITPKLKSVEHNHQGEVGMTIRIVKFGDTVKESIDVVSIDTVAKPVEGKVA